MQVFCALLEKNITMNKDVDVMGIARAKRDTLDFIIMPTIIVNFETSQHSYLPHRPFLALLLDTIKEEAISWASAGVWCLRHILP
jgi:hypothetical protein